MAYKYITQEEKAKAYDKALENAKRLYEQGTITESLAYIFPELKENDYERLRKTTIAFLKDFAEQGYENAVECIDWLERQKSEPNWCHHKVDLSNCSEEYRKAYYDGWNNCNMQHSQCKSDGNDVVKCLINGMKYYYEDNEEATWGTEKFNMKVKDILNWLEKQGESFTWKPITEIPTEHWDRNDNISPLYLVRCGEKNGVSIIGYSNYSFKTNHWIDCCHTTETGVYKVTEWTDIKI